MKAYMYEPTWTQELEDLITTSPVLPLVEEMFYKYGLKAIGTDKYLLQPSLYKVYLTLDGLVYCSVAIDIPNGDVSSAVWQYYSKFYSKQRGKDEEDRRTITAKKLSNLMKSLEKYNAVPSSYEDISNIDIVSNIESLLRSSIAGRNKNLWDIRADSIHEALKVAFEGKSILDMNKEAVIECQRLLDTFNLSDDTTRQRKELVDSFFGKEVYLIGQDTIRGHLIAKISKDANNKMVIEEPFQRVKSLSDYKEYTKIIPAITFMKVYMEPLEKDFSFVRANDPELRIPITDKYFTDIGACTVYGRHPTTFDPCWIAFNA